MGGATRFIMLLSTPFPSLLLHRPSSLFFLRRLRTTTGYTRYLTISPSIKSFQQNLHTHPLKSNTSNQYSQSHPWTEWTNFIGAINYSPGQQQSPSVLDHGLHAEDALVVYEEKELSDDFIRGAAACLAFARARPELLGLLSKKDIEVIVTNGTPFLFKSALDTARKLRGFLGVDGANVFESDKASTVDIMKYILSYASKPVGSSIGNSLFSRELVESSIRNLLCQITQVSFGNVEQNINDGEQRQFFGGYDQTHRPVEQHVQMKKGDWICQKCSFMNFARNMKCLECEEARPKRQLVGGEWECPQCNFFNFGKNIVCLRCDCKQPGEVLSQSGYNAYNFNNAPSMDRKVGENENTWFDASKQSVHTNQSSSLPLSSPSEHQFTSQNNARNMPFVPLPAEKFAKQNQDYKPDFRKDTGEESSQSVSSAANHGSVPATRSSNYSWKSGETRPGSEKIDVVQDKKPENWFQRVSELHDVKDLSSSTSDEDFPEIMPMRKGENHFVVSKKKDRSLTSPAYKRQAAMEEGKNPEFVPFVPFPPGYFAKKDKETPDNMDSSAKLSGETSSSSIVGQTDNDGQQSPDQSPKSPKLSMEQKSPLNGEPSKKTSTIRSMKDEININRFTAQKNTSQPMDLSRGSVQMSENQNIRSIGIGKSLEGSAVKETDPLDMSEEAKAERWFRRVAQIKDISELSQIPDEDFPSIMPMRKGVNRFVVSKRKTPLERRLTSPQYRRNLPSMTSDHVAKDDDSSA